VLGLLAASALMPSLDQELPDRTDQPKPAQSKVS